MTIHRAIRYMTTALPAAILLTAAAPALSSTVYVANNGTDSTFCGVNVINGFNCGARTSPCRSIQCAIREADAGDTILVGPGRYGDLNNDGDQNDPGDEFGSSGCGCMLSVNKAVTLLSSNGAASTVIDGRSLDVARNVFLSSNGGEFGRPGKGFTVTNTKHNLGDGIVIDSADVKVRGNQVLATLVYPFNVVQPLPYIGIHALNGGPILIQGNQVIGQWLDGIVASGTGKTVRNNQVSVNTGAGIQAASGNLVLGNIVIATGGGILVQGSASAVGNSVYGSSYGIGADGSPSSPFTGSIERNNLVGNTGGNCGLDNLGSPTVNAPNNYWGAASGPGPDPADTTCIESGGPITATPFATAAFPLNAPIKP